MIYEPFFSLKGLSDDVFLIEVFPSVPDKNDSRSYKVTINKDAMSFRIKGNAAWVSGEKAYALTGGMVAFISTLIESDADNAKFLEN